MGYTHYWRESLGPNAALCEAARKIVKLAPCKLGRVEIGEDEIVIDGLHGETCETFDFEANGADGFDFCKTRQRPYDVVVTAILAVAAHYERCDVSSDGRPGEWEAGVALAREATGLDIVNPIAANDAEATW